MKRLILTRRHHSKDATYGDLHVYSGTNRYRQHLFFCNILELPWKKNQRNISRVPAATYPLVLEYSPRFGMDLWELKAVPGRSECKFHAANFAYQLNGCMAFARSFKDLDGDGVNDATQSKRTMDEFHKVMGPDREALLTIVDLF